MPRLFAFLAATTILAGCATHDAPLLAVAALETPPPPPAPEAPQAPKPQYGTFGFDTAGMDTSVTPGDDFFQYSNGTWLKNTPIPSDKSNYGAFSVLQDLSQQRVRDILDAQKDDPNSRIGIAYSSFLDEAGVEAKGLAPIQPWLDQVRALKGRAGYGALEGEAARNGITGLFGGFVTQDDRNTDVYITALGQAGLGLPDRDMYLLNEPNMVSLRAGYLDHLTKMLTLAGETNAAARAKAIVDFETKIAKVSWTREDVGDATKTYNKMSLAKLRALAPGFDWAGYLKARNADVTELLVGEPTAFRDIAALSAKAPLQVLKDQLIVQSLDAYADVLPKAIADENFAFYGTKLNGTPENQPRWKRAVDFTTSVLDDDVSKLYVAKWFPPESKAAMDQLVGNVIGAMGRRIEGLTWMAPETKVKAKAKLAAFTPRIGYPTQWHDYTFDVRRDDLFGNALRANQWQHDWNVHKLGQPIYRWEWGFDPMTVNAQANFKLVAITFPAAILQPPFFDPNADPAVNYGAIGAVIGHEMGHGFDDQGRKFGPTGKLHEWWTPAAAKGYAARTDALSKQYSGFSPYPGVTVNGKLTLGENLGDLSGVEAAYAAYKKYTAKHGEPPVIDGLTGDQRFFIAYAQAWQGKDREDAERQQILTDPHSPDKYRVNGIVRNVDAWYKAFNIQPSDKLYLAPEQRVHIW